MENITLQIIQTSLKHETSEVERNCSCEKGITSHDYCPVLRCREKGGKLKDINDIPYGHMFPMQRSGNPVEDRQFRRKVEEANRNGDCIINVGNGYYRPIPGDSTDESELREYLAKELHRARAIQIKRLKMKMTFERWRESGVLTGNSGEIG